jgi:hypothetical protein
MVRQRPAASSGRRFVPEERSKVGLADGHDRHFTDLGGQDKMDLPIFYLLILPHGAH